MAEEVGALRVALSANHQQFEQDMSRARDAVRKNATGMEAAMSRVSKSFGTAASAINRIGGLAAAAAAGGFAAFIKKQIDAADAIGKMAARTGTSSEFLSAMGFVAEQTGTSLDNVAKSTQRLAKNMDDFRRGTGEAQDAFRALGLQVADGEGVLRSTEDVLLDIADKFAGLEDGAEKTQLAIRLFGRSGAELIPMLNKGRDGIEQLQQRAQELGLVIGTDTALQAAYLNDQLNELKNAALGAGRSIALDMLPGLNEAIRTIAYAKEESGLLTAAWVALGAAGNAVFSKSTTQQINETKQAIENLERAQAKFDEAPVRGRIGNLGRAKDYSDRIAELRAELRELEAQQVSADAAERARMEAALERTEREAESRRAATEEMRANLAAQIEADRISKDQVAAEQARIKAQEDAVKAIESQISALELQRDMFGMTEAEATLYKLALMDGVTPAQLELAAAILETIDAQQQGAEVTERAKQITEEVKTAVERYAETMAELSELLLAGAISQETFDRAVVAAVGSMKEAATEAGTGFEDLQRAIEGWGRKSADVFEDLATGGKANFRELIDSMIRDMIRMIAYQQFFGPLFAGIGSATAGGGFAAGWESFGKKAIGGRVGPGSINQVNERGTELLSIGNKQFLMMGNQSGMVTPSGSADFGDITFNIDARGADAQLTRALPAILESFGQRIKGDIAMSRSRGRAM